MNARATIPANPATAKARVTPAASPLLQRKCECGGSAGFENDCEDCKKKKLQRRAVGQGPAHAPAVVHEVLRSPGQPLDTQTRSFFEPRFGHDFSRVRVHADSRAAESAKSVRASAYAVGNDLVFGAGNFAPATKAGKKLLAHELTHSIQQNCGVTSFMPGKLEIGPVNDGLEQEADRIADGIVAAEGSISKASRPFNASRGTADVLRRQPAQPVEQYETTAGKIDRTHLEKLAKASYWWDKVQGVFEVVTDQRLDDPEERDAVLSALWQNQPSGALTATVNRDVEIPARAGSPPPKPLLYRFIFSPKDPAKADAKDKVQIVFMQEGSSIVVAPKAPADFVTTIGYGASDFPADINKFWASHPEEHQNLFYWIEKKSPKKFDQIVTAEGMVTTAGKKVPSRTQFKVSGQRDNQGFVKSVVVTFLGTFSPQTQQIPADYHAKDFGDTLLEKAQANPDPKKNDKLGIVTIPANVPADEVVAVKAYISRYFVDVGTRNAEVDAIIPVPNKTTNVLYTLRFRPNNDVDVERVGEQGKDAKAGQVDPDKLDVARSPEFADQSKDEKTFKGWLKKRYPKVSVTGKTVEELRDNINKEAENNADKPGWFDNYGIKILDEKDGAARLKSVHGYEQERVKDMKPFLNRELKLLESVLETMTLKILAFFKSLRITRQRVAIFKKLDEKNKPVLDDKKKPTFEERPDLGGITENHWVKSGGVTTTSTTIVIFDGFQGDPAQFIGGKEGVLPREAFIYGHELGHVVGNTGIQDQFNKFVKKKNIKPITHYAETGGKDKGGPEKEFFPEAFGLFQEDPEWMRTNLPELYAWFDTLAKTGKAP